MIPDVRAFVSYAHADRVAAGEVQKLLGQVGISAFLAHEDLEVSDEWRESLLRELTACRLFVPLLSTQYLASTWAQQESGFIVSRLSEVVVAPVSLDGTRSAGFLAHLQSPRVKDGITRELLVYPLVARFPRTIIPKLIAAATDAGSYRSAEALVAPMVRHFPLFNLEEAEAFASAAVENGQIWDAALCHSEYLPEFVRVQRENLSDVRRRGLDHVLKHRSWYTGD